MKLLTAFRTTFIFVFLSISFCSYALVKDKVLSTAYVISEEISPELVKFYTQQGFKHRNKIPKLSPLDNLIVYGCEPDASISHHSVTFICDEPNEKNIQEYVYLIPTPSPTDQLNLARAILSEPDHATNKETNVAVIYSRKSELQFKYLLTNLSDKISVSGYRTYGHMMFDESVKRLIKSNDLVLALTDDSIFNKATIRAFFLNTYRERKPVFGPNKDFVKSGSLASLCISELSVAVKAVELSRQFQENEYLPGIYFPSDPSVRMNANVASAFSVPLPADQVILKKIQATNQNESL